MVDVFENAVSIFIHNKDVRSIKTTDGIVVWEKPVQTTTILVFGGDTVSFGQNLVSTGDVTVDWGDGTTEIINNPTTNISHIYSDGETTHTVILDGEITSFGQACFENCTNLTNIVIPNTVTSIGVSSFYNCTNLTNIVIPNTVTSIGNSCFHGCFNLTSVVIPNSVVSLGNSCFYNCTELRSVSIPDSVTENTRGWFGECTNLVDYQLHWIGNNVIPYDAQGMPNNTNTIFTIPNGSANDYIAKDYPSDKLVERSE